MADGTNTGGGSNSGGWGGYLKSPEFIVPLIGGTLDFLGNRSAAKEAGKWQDRAVRIAEQEYSDRKPFRDYAIQGLASMNRPVNSAGLFQDAGNPYSAQYDFSQDIGFQQMPQGTPPAQPPVGAPNPDGDWQPGDPTADAPPGYFGDDVMQRMRDLANQRNREFQPPGMPSASMAGDAGMSAPTGGNRKAMEMQAFLQSYGRGGR